MKPKGPLGPVPKKVVVAFVTDSGSGRSSGSKEKTATATADATGSYLARRSASEQAEIFRKALEEQQERQGRGVRGEKCDSTGAPAIHDDKLYRGYNAALRCWVDGRTHEKQILRERGLVHCG